MTYTGNNSYIYGNTVRREAARPEHIDYDRARQRAAAARKNREAALKMDLPFVLMFTVAAVITLGICINYLRVQSSITTSMKNIEAAEKEFELLKSENDALESSINTGINLDYVYDVATGELGMVYAGKNQIITYTKTESGYVRQNDDIPE